MGSRKRAGAIDEQQRWPRKPACGKQRRDPDAKSRRVAPAVGSRKRAA
ncbi:hypothetical protein [Bacillus sp. FSL M8-0168]